MTESQLDKVRYIMNGFASLQLLKLSESTLRQLLEAIEEALAEQEVVSTVKIIYSIDGSAKK